MDSDQHKPPVPAKQEPSDVQIHHGSDVQATVGYLPRTDIIEAHERVPIALAEGYDALAVELALEPSDTSFFDKLRLITLTDGTLFQTAHHRSGHYDHRRSGHRRQ